MVTLLITRADIESWYQLASNNGNDTKMLNPHIAKAQEIDLVAAIGKVFYLDIKTNPLTTANARLLNGDTYTVDGKLYEFQGLKAVIAHYTMSRRYKTGGVMDMQFGLGLKESEYSTQASTKLTMEMSNQALLDGNNALAGCIDFLNNNAADYPLYTCGSVVANSVSRITPTSRI